MRSALNLRYMLHQTTYWAAAAGVMSFASAYLLEQGFAASRVGVLLACGNLLSCLLQPLLADRADRSGGAILLRLMAGLTAMSMACFASLQLIAMPQWCFGLVYLLGVFTFDAMMPLMNSVCVAYNNGGAAINYGFCRGIGSLAFSLAALAIGEAMAGLGAHWMIWISLGLLAGNLAVVLSYPPEGLVTCRKEEQAAESCSIPVFILRYRWYCVSLLGVMLLAMFHAMTENYLIEVMRRLGGDSGSVGMALFVATVVEMPVILLFDQVRRHIRDNLLLKLAGISFLLKAVLLVLAPSVGAVYLIQCLQATSYSFLSPTQLYYANAKVDPADMVKGQAFITASYTLGCAIGNFTGGQLLQISGVELLLWCGVVMAAAGTAVMFLTVDRRDIPREK